jgi:hypothetical protein
MPFYAADFCNENRQWKYLEPYLKDRPTEQWTEFVVSSARSRTYRKYQKNHRTNKTTKLYKSKLTRRMI